MKKIMIFILLFLMIFQTTSFALDRGRINIEKINLTNSPSYDSDIIKTLSKSDYVKILDSSNNFYKVKSLDKIGWIDKYFVDVSPKRFFVNTSGYNVNLRMSPTTNSKIIDQIKNGEKLKYIDTFHSWYIVEYNNKEVYVAGWLGDIISNGYNEVYLIDEVINIRNHPSLHGDVVSRGNKYNSYSYLGEKEGWYKIGLDNENYGYVASWLMSNNNNFFINDIQNYKVTTDNLRLRSGPSLSDSIITVMPKGTEVRVIGSSSDWNKIVTWNGFVGYSHQDYLAEYSPLSGKKILLNPGHGGRDPGAISPTGKYEKNVNLNVSFMVKDFLESYGAEVVLTRDKDISLSRVKRATMAETLKADIMFSIHHNALNDDRYYGMSTYYDTKNNANGSLSYELAESVYNSVVGINSIYRDGIYDRNFEVLRSTNVPAALIEIGFLSSPWEEKNIHNHSFQYEVSKQIALGIIDYFKK